MNQLRKQALDTGNDLLCHDIKRPFPSKFPVSSSAQKSFKAALQGGSQLSIKSEKNIEPFSENHVIVYVRETDVN